MIPGTFKELVRQSGISHAELLSGANQEKLFDTLIMGRPNVKNYLKGTNDGNQKDLENAVQALAFEFSSFPIVDTIIIAGYKQAPAPGSGDVTTGVGKRAAYGAFPPNHDYALTNIDVVVKALIKSRTEYSGKRPIYIPTYVT
jgi:hypothetical protein